MLVFYNDEMYLLNDTDSPISLRKGQTLALYFKGKWQTGCTATEDKHTIPFVLSTSDDLVVVGTETLCLKDVVEEKRTEDPLKAKVAYHDMVDNASTGFTLTVKHRHAWKSEASERPDNVEAVLTKACAGWAPHGQWTTRSTAMTWIVKWSAKGLTPVRPLVILKHGIRFDPKSYLKLVV